MMSFDPEHFVLQLMAIMRSQDFDQRLERSLNLALDEMGSHTDEQSFRTTVIAYIQSVYRHFPPSLTLSDANAWDLANRMLDLAYPCEGSPGSTAAYLDYASGDVCTAEHLYSTLICGLKQHLQNQYIQSELNEHLADLSFADRMAIAHFVQPQYEQLAITIPTHHLAHSLESVLLQVIDSRSITSTSLPEPVH